MATSSGSRRSRLAGDEREDAGVEPAIVVALEMIGDAHERMEGEPHQPPRPLAANAPVHRVLDQLQPRRRKSDYAFEALDLEAGISHHLAKPDAGPAPVILGVGVVDEDAVGRKEQPSAGTEHPKAFAQVER